MTDVLREILGLLDVKVTGQEQVTKAQASIEKFRATMAKPVARLSIGERDEDMFAAAGRRSLTGLGQDLDVLAEHTKPAAGALDTSMINLAAGMTAAGQIAGAARRVFDMAVVPIRDMVAETIRLGDALDATSKRTGMSSTELQRWQFIAERGNVDADLLTGSIGKLERAAFAAASGSKAQAAAFRGIGVSVKDANGQLKPAGDLFREVGIAISGVQNPVERAARAQQVFGRAGAALLPIFADGAAGVDALSQRFDELGGGLSEDVVADANAADDAMTDFDQSMRSLKATLSADLLPTLAALISGTATTVGWLSHLVSTSSTVETVLGALGVAGVVATVGLLPLILPVVAIAAGLAALFLVAEDVVTAFRGGESVFGSWEESIASSLGVTLTFSGQLQMLGNAWLHLRATALDSAAGVLDAVQRVQAALGMHVDTTLAATAHANAAAAAGEARSGDKQLVMDEQRRRGERAVNAAQDAIAAAQPNAALIAKARADQEGSARGSRWSRADQRGKLAVRAPVTIHVHGAGDAHQTARVVEERIQAHLRSAADDLPGEGDDELDGEPA